MTIKQTLWQHESAGNALVADVVGYPDKIEGQHVWPFSIDLPELIRLDKHQWHDVNSREDVRLPPTLLSKAFGWDVNYKLVVEVKRAGLLSVDDT